MLVSTRKHGFTNIELVIIIIVVGLLGAYAIAKYVSMSKSAEGANVEYVIGSLRSALNIYSAKQIATGQPITIHNPFDDLGNNPPNYAGAFGDVNSSTCHPGEWAYQTGDASNGNWGGVIGYNPKEALSTGFSWEGKLWIVLVISTITDANGTVIGLSITDYPPAHGW